MQSKQYFTKIKNYPHEKSTEPLKYVPLPYIKRNLTVYEIDKAIIYCCWEIGI